MGALTTPTDTMSKRPNYLVRYGWKEVGHLIVAPAATVGGPDTGAGGDGAAAAGFSPVPLQPPAGRTFPVPGYDLRLMSLVDDVGGIPTVGKRLIIVAAVKNVLHFRIFDGDGQMVVDTDETKLTTQGGPIENLRKQLESLWPPHKLTESEKARVIAAVTSIVGYIPVLPKTQVLVQDVNGNGALGIVDSATSMHLVDPVPVLVPPLQVLFNLLSVTRGKTVPNEVLGSGNALVAGQYFILQNAPVTYLQSADSKSGDNYSSTVRVWVNQLEWKEVRSFYGQPPGAQVFITREDEQGRTHVVFGDGQNGARLPTGVNNVVASYRYGSGAAAPAAGSLTVVLQPQPGLRAIRNPVPVGGGSDPDPPHKIRRLAPRSALTFNRAISVDDFEVVAAQAPGVTRAKAAISFDPLAQRPRVTVWVGDDAGAVTATQAAFAASADPNRQPRVVLAQAVIMTLSLTIVYDPRRDRQAVHDAVHQALVDPDTGLLGLNIVAIGQAFYDSQIYAACRAVPGVVAVHSLRFAVTSLFLPPILTRLRELRLPRVDLANTSETLGPEPTRVRAAPPSCSGQRHDPGDGAYLFLPDDDQHLQIAMEAAS